MKNLLRLFTTKLTVVLFMAMFAFGTGQIATAQSGGMGGMGNSGDTSGGGGHGAGMANEDPVPFTHDIEKAADDILSQLKAGRTMDARNSVSRLTTATDKVTPHITDTALKDRLTIAVNEVRTIAGTRSPDLLELEDKVDTLQMIIEEVRKKLQGMN
ncbi:MAG: hypothetical protein LBB98_07835 [Treponema sp.]|nr:hypothetical protein [Treponema sp.]